MSDQSAAFDEELRQVEDEVVHILIAVGVFPDEDEIRGNRPRVRLHLTRFAKRLANLSRRGKKD